MGFFWRRGKVSTGLNPFLNNKGLLRMKSRICNKKDDLNFIFPIILTSKHPVVINLIFEKHVQFCYVGTQGLVSLLRVINKCVITENEILNLFFVESASLPLDRVRGAKVFEIVGVDLTGSLYLKDGKENVDLSFRMCSL